MKFVIFFLILISLFILCNYGPIEVYDPPSTMIHLTFNEVETGNKLIDISEVNVLLLLMVVGIFILVR